jgi:hypothetical protein
MIYIQFFYVEKYIEIIFVYLIFFFEKNTTGMK